MGFAKVGRVMFVVGIMGCGTVGARPDAPAAIDATIDATIDALPLRCDPKKPFGEAHEITALRSDTADDAGWLTSDGLTIYFSSRRPRPGDAGPRADFDIYMSTRMSLTAPWRPPELVPGVNTDLMDRHPTLSPDGLTLYAERVVDGKYKLLVATRSTTSERFGLLREDPMLNVPGTNDASPFVMGDRTMLFDSDRGAPGRRAPYQATWNGSEYTEIAMLRGVGGDWNTAAPMMTADKLTLYFASDRDQAGDYDIWVATRASPTDDFSNAINLTSLSKMGTDDGPNWVSADGCVLNFTRGPISDYDLYEAVKPL